MTFTWEHVLYRFYDKHDALLYIGITGDLDARFRRHASLKPWWCDVDRCTTEFRPSRLDLEAAEKAAIRAERPRYNVRHAARPAHTVAAPPSVDLRVLIASNGDVLRPTPTAGAFDLVCTDPANLAGWPRPGHEDCSWDTAVARHRCNIHEPAPERATA